MWPTYLFAAGSINLLQCLSMIHKNGTNHRNDVTWRLLLLEQIPTFGELDDKKTRPNHWKRNNFTWNLLQKCAVWNKALQYHTHLVQHCFCPILGKAIRQRKAFLSMGFGKTSIKFNVPSLNKCQLVSLIFENTEWQSWDGKNCFNSHCWKKCVFQILFSYFILRILAVVIQHKI